MGTTPEVPVSPNTPDNLSSHPDTLNDAALEGRLREAAARQTEDAGANHADDGELLALTAGHLAPERTEVVERHLARCAACRELLANLSRPVSPSLMTEVEGRFPKAPTASARPARHWVFPVSLSVLAAAAALLVAVGVRPGETGPRNSHPDFDWVAGYRAEAINGGVQAIRSEGLPESISFNSNSHLTWTLMALDSAPTPVVSAYVGPVAGNLHRVALKVEHGPDGTVVVSGEAKDLLGPQPGLSVLAVVLGPAEVDLDGRPAASLSGAVPAARGVLFEKTLRYESGGSP